MRVNVESRSVPRVVSVERHGQTLRATVALGNGGLAQAGDESLQAAAHFLLRASSSLRFARAWASGSADAPGETGFECWFCPATGDAPLVTAIDALTTACDRFGAEVEALIGSTAVARQYLQTFAPGRAGVAKPAAYRRAAPANGSSPFDASEAVLV